MKVCYRAGKVTRCDNYFAIDTDGAPIRLWFLTDDILRIVAAMGVLADAQ